MRKRFDEQLAELSNNIMQMSAYVETAIAKAGKALVDQDKEMAKETIAGDALINELEKEIEGNCLKLILQQQPIARDLRLISTALKIITDMERIGDHAADISGIVLKLVKGEYPDLDHIPLMAEETIKMVGTVIQAYVNKDLEEAKRVITQDDIVDQLFSQVKKDLVLFIKEDTNNGEQALNLLMIAKYFERIGDHAVNIAEWVIFSITGKHKNHRIL